MWDSAKPKTRLSCGIIWFSRCCGYLAFHGGGSNLFWFLSSLLDWSLAASVNCITRTVIFPTLLTNWPIKFSNNKYLVHTNWVLFLFWILYSMYMAVYWNYLFCLLAAVFCYSSLIEHQGSHCPMFWLKKMIITSTLFVVIFFSHDFGSNDRVYVYLARFWILSCSAQLFLFLMDLNNAKRLDQVRSLTVHIFGIFFWVNLSGDQIQNQESQFHWTVELDIK